MEALVFKFDDFIVVGIGIIDEPRLFTRDRDQFAGAPVEVGGPVVVRDVHFPDHVTQGEARCPETLTLDHKRFMIMAWILESEST